MTFFEILSALLIGPLKLAFEVVYVLTLRVIGNLGFSIVALSLLMNFLVLPLYRRADAMQEQARDTENKLHKGVAHIKKAFSGDEQMMVLQTYYRQNDYRPTDALRGSVSLLLEIPFFIAAYQFLSHLELLSGVAFGPIADLSAPDGLLTVGGMSVNLLPIIMTLINVISGAIYLKGFPAKTKLQLYGMALIFLVLLYGSPSGLVLYWTCNNIFSLCKNIFYKLKNPKKALRLFLSVTGVFAAAFGVYMFGGTRMKTRIAFVVIGAIMQLPLLVGLFDKKRLKREKKSASAPNRKLFFCTGAFLTVLIGLVIPSAYIAVSPQEYISLSCFRSPLWYVVNASCLACGTFIIWVGVFYWLAGDKGKVAFERVMCVLCAAAVINYMFFGTELGIISSKLQYEGGLLFSQGEKTVNAMLLAAVIAVVYFAAARFGKSMGTALIVGAIALCGMGTVNVFKSWAPIQSAKEQAIIYKDETAQFELSTTGKNVVIIMMDRALGELVPFIMDEKPELREEFDGFTYYSNTISHGLCTNFGTPGLFGGYEYTPVEMNRRDTETLAEKHNEALKVMPVLFWENGYDVTVCDPTYAGYQHISDLSIYDEYPGIESYITIGRTENIQVERENIEDTARNFFCFALMKVSPVLLQQYIYADGTYNQAKIAVDTTYQTITDWSTASGQFSDVMANYNVLEKLLEMATITEEDKNTYFSITNNLTHARALFQKPDYTPSDYVDNSAYDENLGKPITVDGKELNMDNQDKVLRYHVNMATYVQLGRWFDYLRENGVYDNTRIIIVSDHGFGFEFMDGMQFSDKGYGSAEWFFPLLLVKDFDSHGFTTSDEFMTNADVPTLATADIIENPTNPFTGKPINSDEKHAHDQFVIMSDDWDVLTNNGNTFHADYWASVHDSLWDMDNWTVSESEAVLKDYVMP